MIWWFVIEEEENTLAVLGIEFQEKQNTQEENEKNERNRNTIWTEYIISWCKKAMLLMKMWARNDKVRKNGGSN